MAAPDAFPVFCDTVMRPRAGTRETWPTSLNTPMAEFGFGALYTPSDKGGAGLDYPSAMDMFETVARADAALAFGWSVHNAGTDAILRNGTAPLRDRWAAKLAAGQMMAGFALTEPQGGSDPVSMTTRGRVNPDGSITVHGTKAWVSLAGIAAVFPTVVKLGDRADHRDMAMLAIPADAPGVSFGPRYAVPGLDAVPVADMMLNDVIVPADAVLLPAGEGLAGALSGIDIARVCVAAASCGLIDAALAAALAHAHQRKLYDAPQITLDGVQWMLGDVATQLDLARLITQQAARALGTQNGRVLAAKAKLVAPEAALSAVETCIQVMGGQGLRAETGLSRMADQARAFRVVDGASEVQRKIIGRDLMRRAAPEPAGSAPDRHPGTKSRI